MAARKKNKHYTMPLNFEPVDYEMQNMCRVAGLGESVRLPGGKEPYYPKIDVGLTMEERIQFQLSMNKVRI